VTDGRTGGSPVKGDLSEFRYNIWYAKLRMVGVPVDVTVEDMFSRFDTVDVEEDRHHEINVLGYSRSLEMVSHSIVRVSK